MREFRAEEEQQHGSMQPTEGLLQQPGERHEQPAERQQPFTQGGEIPPVSAETGFDQGRTAGVLAFDGDNHRAHHEVAAHSELEGRYGTYHVRQQWVNADGEQALQFEVEMTPNENVPAGGNIAWVQVVRRSKIDGEGWAKEKSAINGMDDTRVKRVDQKSGFRVDRERDATHGFYGMKKDAAGNVSADTNTRVGQRDGAKPWLWDRPKATHDNLSMEFVATATDLDSGKQFDAIRWGFDKHFNAFTPKIIKSDDPLLAGRDRAIDKFNKDGHENRAGKGIDAIPRDFNPGDAAGLLQDSIATRNIEGIRMTLGFPANADPEHRARIQGRYKDETGTSLSDALKEVLDAKDEKAFKDWL